MQFLLTFLHHENTSLNNNFIYFHMYLKLMYFQNSQLTRNHLRDEFSNTRLPKDQRCNWKFTVKWGQSVTVNYVKYFQLMKYSGRWSFQTKHFSKLIYLSDLLKRHARWLHVARKFSHRFPTVCVLLNWIADFFFQLFLN